MKFIFKEYKNDEVLILYQIIKIRTSRFESSKYDEKRSTSIPIGMYLTIIYTNQIVQTKLVKKVFISQKLVIYLFVLFFYGEENYMNL